MGSIKDKLERIAREFLRIEKDAKENCAPPQTSVIVRWRNELYVEGIQEIAQAYSPEIVLLSKTGYQLPELGEAIKRLDPERLELLADDSLDIRGRYHILRRLESRLTLMTPEQTKYVAEDPLEIVELNSIENPKVYPKTIKDKL